LANDTPSTIDATTAAKNATMMIALLTIALLLCCSVNRWLVGKRPLERVPLCPTLHKINGPPAKIDLIAYVNPARLDVRA
jgi:hypothetical protein